MTKLIRVILIVITINVIINVNDTFSQSPEVPNYGSSALARSLAHYDNDELDKALAATMEFKYDADSYIIRGMIYYKMKRYNDAINEINTVKTWIFDVFSKSKSAIEKTKFEVFYEFLYFKSHLVLGLSHYELKHFEPAGKSLAIVAEHHKSIYVHEAARIYGYAGYAYYKLKDYDEAIKNMKLAFELVSSVKKGDKKYKFRQALAYSIGSVNAVKGNVDDSIKWLRIPLVDDPQGLLSDIKNDADFEPIRKNKKFNEFLDKYRKPSAK